MIVKFDSKKRLRANQHVVFHDNSRFKVCACGRRWGKSILATYVILTKALQEPNSNFFFVAPTFAQARQIIWDILKDKVRNKLAKNINESRLEVELINGSKIFLKGADRADTMRGVSLSGLVLDEFATMRDSEEVWKQVLRPALSDKQGWALFISSPKGRDYFYDLYNEAKTKDDWNSWQFTTLEGGNVPEEEIAQARNELDERSFRQEYEGSFESFDGLVCPNFDRALNESFEEIQDHDTLIMGVDFNVNKMPCGVHIKRGQELHLVDEFFGSFNTHDLMEAIKQRYPNHKIIFHTDASGNANKSSAGGKTDLDIIRSYGYTIYNLSRNPNIIDRVNAHNSMICSADGTRRYFIHKSCKRGIEAHEKHVFDENGLPNKKHEWFDDVFDSCFSGDTLVIVNNKLMEFKDIPKEGLIRGHNGKNVKYINGGMIRKDILLEIKLSDGTIIKATPNHKFLTLDGWVEAQHLKGKTLCNTELYQKVYKSSMVKNTIKERMTISIRHLETMLRKTRENQESLSIEKFGSFITGRYRKATSFIIKTITNQTMTLKILNLWTQGNIIDCTRYNFTKKTQNTQGKTSKEIKTNAGHGTSQKSGINGIKSIMKNLKTDFIKRRLLNVRFVEKKQNCKTVKIQNTAQENAYLKLGEIQELITKKETAQYVAKNMSAINTVKKKLVVESVEQYCQIGEEKKTYCVEVPNNGCFSLADGTIVMNCSYASWHYSEYGNAQIKSANLKFF